MTIALTEQLVAWVECSRCPSTDQLVLDPNASAEEAEADLRDHGWSCADEHLCPDCCDGGAEQDPQVWAAEARGDIFRSTDGGSWFGPGPTVDDLEVKR